MSLEGGGHQEENEAGIPKPRGEVGFSLLEDRREGKRGYEQGLQCTAGEGCGRLSGVGAPHGGWDSFHKAPSCFTNSACVHVHLGSVLLLPLGAVAPSA